MKLCPTCGNGMTFHYQYHQWYCPMCNASQIKEALRNQQPAFFHYQPSQSFFSGVPIPLQAIQQSLEDCPPISGSLYCSMPPTSQNQDALPHQQELALALAQRCYQIMQQQGRLPVSADQQQMSQQQIKLTRPPSNSAQEGSIPQQYPWWPTAPLTVPMQASWPVAPAQYVPNQYAQNIPFVGDSSHYTNPYASTQQPLDLSDDEIRCLFTAAVDGRMPTLDSEPYFINQYEADNSSYLGEAKMETKLSFADMPINSFVDSRKVDVYVTPYRLCYTFTSYAKAWGPGQELSAILELGSWLWSKAKKRRAGACSWFKIDMRGRSWAGNTNDIDAEMYTKNKYFSFFPPTLLYRLIRGPKKYIHMSTNYQPTDKNSVLRYRRWKEIRLSPKSDFSTWKEDIENHVYSARGITLESLANFYSDLDIEFTKTNRDYIF